MTVYVDESIHPFGRMTMCHMWADTLDELYRMVDTIGVQRKWLQRPAGLGLVGMDASWIHFDIAKAKRALAVKAGAVETDRYGPLYWRACRDGNIAGMRMIDDLRKRH